MNANGGCVHPSSCPHPFSFYFSTLCSRVLTLFYINLSRCQASFKNFFIFNKLVTNTALRGGLLPAFGALCAGGNAPLCRLLGRCRAGGAAALPEGCRSRFAPTNARGVFPSRAKKSAGARRFSPRAAKGAFVPAKANLPAPPRAVRGTCPHSKGRPHRSPPFGSDAACLCNAGFISFSPPRGAGRRDGAFSSF